MLHPSYSDLIKVVNSEVEEGETPVVNSRYSIVMATSKRARQIVDGSRPLVDNGGGKKKALSMAVEELEQGLVKIMSEDDEAPVEDAGEAVDMDMETEVGSEEPAADEDAPSDEEG